MFNVNYNSVKAIVGILMQNGSAEIKPRSGQPKKMTTRRERSIISEMKKNRRSKTQYLVSRDNKNQNIKISRFTLKRLLNKNGYL